MTDWEDVADWLQEQKQDLEDPEAVYEIERMEDHYHHAKRVEYGRDK